MNLCLLLVLICMLSLIAMSRVILCVAVCLEKRKRACARYMLETRMPYSVSSM